jgi:pimeloyl-ACP methyl ester carboxylesterase
MFVQLFARTYPAEVAGVVAINPVPPADPWLAEVQAVFTEAQYAEEEAYYRGANGESLDYSASSQQILGTATPDAVFLEMVLSTDLQCEGAEICLVSYGIYEQSLMDLTASWPHGTYTQVAALHDIIRDDPAAVLEAVDRILAATG